MSNVGLSSPYIYDVDGDGKTDWIYAGDMAGNLWKFELCRWRQKCCKGLVMNKIRKGDEVVVLAGKDMGKRGLCWRRVDRCCR